MMVIVFMVFFLMSIQPIMMVVSLIFISLFYSLYLYMMMGSYWFSYILIMVVLSGVLVVFTYMVSLIPNESFEIYSLLFLVMIVLVVFKMELMLYSNDSSMMSLDLWVSLIGVMNLFLVIFLFGMMVMVVWVSCLKYSAVRVG